MDTVLSDYADRYDTIWFERHDGILLMTLHTDDGSVRWSGVAHGQLADAFADVAADPENLVVILTGAGDEFTGPHGSAATFPGASPSTWEPAHRAATRLLANLLDVSVPMISAINGPVLRHCEIPLLSDIVLASETAVFKDSSHFVVGLVPGDGGHLVLPLIMGLTRARYFLLTGESVDARRALEYGMVNEVVAPDQLLPRAWEVARALAKQPPLALRYTRMCFTHTLRQLVASNQGFGLMLEGMVAIDAAQRPGFAGYMIPARH